MKIVIRTMLKEYVLNCPNEQYVRDLKQNFLSNGNLLQISGDLVVSKVKLNDLYVSKNHIVSIEVDKMVEQERIPFVPAPTEKLSVAIQTGTFHGTTSENIVSSL